MKEFISIQSYLVSPLDIGDWDGEEDLAADILNRIYHTVYARADEDIDTGLLEELLEAVWSYWQHNPGLTELDEDEVDAFVDWLYSQVES
ncbi:hypothetical protein [Paraferrimonas sedimenticola]|uniref:Uncharacterized protein n=1 Tax=Paraferrimonas sedimenticola TaxID=375674 RepID=A0AA37S0D3_9GAMM|nr:hypothetical protein [Paraferrimonas sedimenticola]GLP98073.1 hypothetical protein GCM10007895_33800 [Paraferrimonas sedimenticola]